MSHHLVNILRVTRKEFRRCLNGLSEEDARRRLEPMNCISWIVGHMASHENACWVEIAQDKHFFPGLTEKVGYGSEPGTPVLAEMWTAWQAITQEADIYLNTLTPDQLAQKIRKGDEETDENVGTMLTRNILHYWFHLGEAHAIRQQLGHKNLPEFVGDLSNATYKPE